ncbi:putative hydroxymethylpyrimidine transporter CytX [Microvirga sp. W0021]|uniref:Hydroxymethylpyrimidine transporter CytX n=1 Tax=Hohaiivirga grylli TaxID=3133970 RepID=A0ABV0BG49_9HYPH
MQTTHSYSWFSLALLWFGAAVSVAEIMTGGMIAAAGLWPGLWAILLGHIVGVILLGLVALIGFREKMPSIMCTRISFGQRGSWLLSVANVIQLIGWAAVMVQQSGLALGGIINKLWNIEATTIAIVIMGALIGLWSLWEVEGRQRKNTITVILLFLLTVFISWVLWGKAGDASAISVSPEPPMPFSKAFELSFIMPLSWLPLVADYAYRSRSASAATLAPSLGYLVGSLWMYGIGFIGALYTGEADPTPMLLAAGLGIVALSIVALSTIMTTFLDVYSAVASARNIVPELPEKGLSIAVISIGTLLALYSNIYENFLMFIGAIFAPMAAILLTDYFLLRHDARSSRFNFSGLISLGLGFAAFFICSRLGSPLGGGLSSIVLTAIIHVLIRKSARSHLLKASTTTKS